METVVWLVKPERGSPRRWRRWDNNIKMNFRETGCEVVKWMQLAEDRDQWWAFANTVMNFRVS
jgi:hypothetical protein